AEAADVAALSGRHAGTRAAAFVRDGTPWPAGRIAIRCAPPLHWVAPNAVAPGAGPPLRGRLAPRAHALLERPEVDIAQDARPLWRGRLRRVQPGRSAALPATWLDAVDHAGGPVEIRVLRARLAAGMHE